MNEEKKNELIKSLIRLGANENLSMDEIVYLLGLIYKDKAENLTLTSPLTPGTIINVPYVQPYDPNPLPWWEQNKIWCSTNTTSADETWMID